MLRSTVTLIRSKTVYPTLELAKPSQNSMHRDLMT